jgi:hypothetical protein
MREIKAVHGTSMYCVDHVALQDMPEVVVGYDRDGWPSMVLSKFKSYCNQSDAWSMLPWLFLHASS